MTRGRRTVLLVVHTGRRAAVAAARELTGRLAGAGIDIHVLESEADVLHREGAGVVAEEGAGAGAELVVALGGDGTLLRAAEIARPAGTPLLGVNLGHVGFLAEADHSDLDMTVERIVARTYDIEDRLTLDLVVVRPQPHQGADRVVDRGWALNDVTVEKASRERMLDVVVEVDGRPLSRWGCDGVVCATPTGSTAYAFSAGGPVMWPSLEALLVVPVAAHALFARPLVVSPDSCIAVELRPELSGGVVFCDGRRTLPLNPSDRVEVRRGDKPVRLVRLHAAPFTDRLVDKFRLPVRGWRGRVDDD